MYRERKSIRTPTITSVRLQSTVVSICTTRFNFKKTLKFAHTAFIYFMWYINCFIIIVAVTFLSSSSHFLFFFSQTLLDSDWIPSRPNFSDRGWIQRRLNFKGRDWIPRRLNFSDRDWIPRRLNFNYRDWIPCRLNFSDRDWIPRRLIFSGSPLADFSTLKMEAIRSSEMSVNARSTQRHIPEDDILQDKRKVTPRKIFKEMRCCRACRVFHSSSYTLSPFDRQITVIHSRATERGAEFDLKSPLSSS
jgi:hypothetical protein